MKERPELLTAEEYDEICKEMLAFQEANNRLSYSDEETGETSPMTVEDKSFSLVEDPTPQAEAEVEVQLAPVVDDSVQQFTPPPQIATKGKTSLLDSVRGFFRS